MPPMITRYFLAPGKYLQRLFRSRIKTPLLPTYNGRFDYDGYLTAILSLLLMLLTAGLTLLMSLVYTWWTAKTTPVTANGKHVIVLGKRLQNNAPDHDYRLRLERAAELAHDNPDRRFYLLGGTTGNAEISESLAGLYYLESKGINPDSVNLEQSSRSTLENLKQLCTHVAIPDNRIVLITNRYHLARAGIMARQFGYSVVLCAAEADEVKGLFGKLVYLGEAVLQHWFLTGLFYAKATRNTAMLKRICR